MVSLGVVGIFGPQDKVIGDHVQSICDTMDVPHISVRQDCAEPSQPRGVGLNLYPHVSSLARVSIKKYNSKNQYYSRINRLTTKEKRKNDKRARAYSVSDAKSIPYLVHM